jgi:hypothetical protein
MSEREEFIPLVEAMERMRSNWRSGFGLLGDSMRDRERLLRWLGNERVIARADEVVEYVVVEPSRAEPHTVVPPHIDGETTYRIVPSGQPIGRHGMPVERRELCHVYMRPEIFSFHDLLQHPTLWDDNELTIFMTDGSQARTIFYDIHIDRVGLDRALGNRAAPAATPTQDAVDRPMMRAAETDIISAIQSIREERGTLPGINDLSRELRSRFESQHGRRVTRQMVESALDKAGLRREPGRRDLPDDNPK